MYLKLHKCGKSIYIGSFEELTVMTLFKKRSIPYSYAIKGGIFGYLFLHPLTMFINNVMHHHMLDGNLHWHTLQDGLIQSLNAFSVLMLPWAMVFTLVGVVLGLYFGSLQTRLKKHRDELEAKVATRTAELIAANEELKSVARLKNDIISNVSHELRTPITITRGSIELLDEENDPEARSQLRKMAINALERQNQIVEDLVAAANIQKRGVKLNLEPVDVTAAITLTCHQTNAKAIEKKIKLLHKCQKDLPPVYADYKKLQHILINLLHNALKFTDPGGKITIDAIKKDGVVEVSMTDTGIGIPEDTLDKIFDPLYQADPSSTRMFEGTGMGLAIVKDLIEAHDGKLSVKSRWGEGSIFCFTLPIVTS
jgi:signal transduction histidine kinase